MKMKRCPNGHLYDFNKNSSCPYCNKDSIAGTGTMMKPKNVNYKRSMAALDNEVTMGNLPSTPAPSSNGDGKTIAFWDEKMGIRPVVGWFICIEGPDKGRDYRIKSEKNFIGRSDSMDIYIAGDSSMSRKNHAVVSFNPKNNNFMILPGDGTGLIYLNEEVVYTPELLVPYDVVEMGRTKLMFVPFCGENFQW